MADIKSVSAPSEIDSDTYWKLVRRTLEDIFYKHGTDADGLEQWLTGRNPDEQILFYHSEPLSIAAEIADEVPTQNQFNLYKKLRDTIFPP